MSTAATGLFRVSYLMTNTLGGPTLTLHLTVDTQSHVVSGKGIVTQAINPSVYDVEPVVGKFIYTYTNDTKNQLIIIHSPHNEITARIVVNENWEAQAGVFTYHGERFESTNIQTLEDQIAYR